MGIVTLERVMGIEPTSSAWKAEVLPLNYTRRSVPDNTISGCRTPLSARVWLPSPASCTPSPDISGRKPSQILWWKGRITPGLPALRPPGRHAARGVQNRSRGFVEPLIGSHPPPIPPGGGSRRPTCQRLLRSKPGGGGRITPGLPALRPPGRHAVRGVQNRSRGFVEPLIGSHPPPVPPGGGSRRPTCQRLLRSKPGGGGRIRTSEG